MILRALLHPLRVLKSKLRERKKERARSSHWTTTRRHWLEVHPACAACGSRKHPQVHHKQPFHLAPELELVPTNLITLCMSLKECHLRLGHGGDFEAWNPTVEDDVKQVALNPLLRKEVERRAKLGRQYGG